MTEGTASFLETLVWAALCIYLFWRYSKSVEAALKALLNRIEQGSSVKMGPVEFGELKAQSSEQQIQKLDSEVRDLVDGETVDGAAIAPPPETEVIRARYLSAEDLAMREIQAEFGSPISRQMTLGPDIGFDGFFSVGGRGYVVEVKMLGRRFIRQLLSSAIRRIESQLSMFNWRNVGIILAVVFSNDDVDLEKERANLIQEVTLAGREVLVRCYSLPALAAKYKVSVPQKL